MPNGETSVATVRIWNETVSNLTLMALGSSAPEILLSVIEVRTHTHTHNCTHVRAPPPPILSLLISPFHLLTQSSSPASLPRLVCPGVRPRFQGRRAGPGNHRRQRRLQHVCNHRHMCVDHSQRREPQDQTPPGVLHHRLLEHLCLHLALPHPVCHDSWSCGCKAEWAGNNMLIESAFL